MAYFEKPEDLPDLMKTREQLDEFIEIHRDMTLKYLADAQDKSWSPKLAVKALDYDSGEEENIIVALACDFSTFEEKHQIMYSMGQMFHQKQKVPILVCMITEAWRTKKEEFGEAEGNSTPKDDPDRDEVIVFFGSTFGLTEQVMGTIETDRHPDGYLMPGPKSELVHEGRSALMESFWVGMAESAMASIKKGREKNG